MIIDLILDRKDGQPYNAREFYNDVMQYAETWPEMANPITRAMDDSDENDVRRELCAYIDSQDYNPEIKDYINSVQWLPTLCNDTQRAVSNLETLVHNIASYASFARVNDRYGEFYEKQEAAQNALLEFVAWLRQHGKTKEDIERERIEAQKAREQKEAEQWEEWLSRPREFHLTDDDKKTLLGWGYLEEDLEQIEMECNYCVFTQQFKNKPEKELTRDEVIKKLGRKRFLSGIGRTAFHWNCGRDKGNIYVHFESGLPGRNINEFKY